MKSNYFVSYDLMAPGQHYAKVMDAIKQTGNWAKVGFSHFYVRSDWSAQDIAAHVWAHMTPNDKLLVIDASNNRVSAFNIDAEAFAQVQKEWFSN